MIKKFTWFLQRISVMNAQEILHRINEQARLTIWSIQYKFGYKKSIKGCEADFSFCNTEEYFLPKFSWKTVEQKDVQAIVESKVNLFGGSISFDRNADESWRTAPETHKLWPLIFFASINYREGNPFGDVRITWEASRLQYFVTIALYIEQNPDTELKAALLDIIRTDIISWHKQNPLMQGIHYISSMECAIRILVLTVTCDLLRAETINDSDIWKTLTKIVLEHAYFIRRRLSLYSSTGNHTLAETAGLIYAGVLFAEHRSANDWLDTGIRLFTQELDNQLDMYGVGKEQAIRYTLQILEYGLLVEKLLRHRGILVPQALDSALTRGIKDIKAIYSMLGTIPSLGDNDSGNALSPYLDELWSVPIEENDNAVYTNGSLTLMQGQRSMADFVTLIDHGPLGMQPNYSHGHADALSVTMYRNGRAILVDPGTYSYTGAPKLRNYFRSTKAHNTATVNHLDQATKKMLFMWSKPYTCDLQDLRSEHDLHTAVAKHNGFKALGIDHVRRIILHHEHGLFVFDDFLGQDHSFEHTFEIYWHIDGSVEEIADGGFRLSEDKLNINFSDAADCKIIRASKDGTYGWTSESYFSRKPINTLILSARSTLPFTVVTSFITDKAYENGNGQWWIHDGLDKTSIQRCARHTDS